MTRMGLGHGNIRVPPRDIGTEVKTWPSLDWLNKLGWDAFVFCLLRSNLDVHGAP